MSLTPMMKQFGEIKEQHKDCILFFRLGDFYEMFGEDANKASKILNIALTARNKGENKIPMCGIPFHAAPNYISKLTKQGLKVAICEQVSDPALPGIVKREVVKIITPGATFDENILENKSNNYLAALLTEKNVFGLAFADLTTGEFKACEFNNLSDLKNELKRLNPGECIVNPDLKSDKIIRALFSDNETYLNDFKSLKLHADTLKNHFKVKNLEGFGLKDESIAASAAGFLLEYLIETQKTELKHINKLTRYNPEDFMYLDEATLRNLELFFLNSTLSGQGSLLEVVDKTETSMGGRMLKNWLKRPLNEKSKIEYRLNGVNELFLRPQISADISNIFKKIMDLERVVARIASSTGSARDLINLKTSLKKIPEVKNTILNFASGIIKDIGANLEIYPELVDALERAIVEEPPFGVKEGGMIKAGYLAELDEIKNIRSESKNYLAALQVREIKRTGINSLKVRFNKVFGYYIEISKVNLRLVPEDYIRKQTLVNAERFITPELKDYEEKILTAEEKINELEYKIFLELREKVMEKIPQIQKTAKALAALDVINAFAALALHNNYVLPELTEDGSFEIINGRHPVIEKSTLAGEFVPNDLYFNQTDTRFILLTGPNMSGKSTYLRQNALIVLLAQIGSFVPASKAKISVVDRIFTRVGAQDNLNRGQSTFMVEMQEAANILNHATEKSLIILDEIGRGTSTYDGLSIAWAIMEFIHNKLKAKTLFATHYHELITLAEKLGCAQNFSVAVKENPEQGVVFLHKVVKGGIDRSYGIEVAKLAGLPEDITLKAEEILKSLEQDNFNQYNEKREHVDIKDEEQLNIFEFTHPALEELKKIDLNNMTPLKALQKLDELKKSL